MRSNPLNPLGTPELSLPEERNVRGITVRRMPLGAFLRAISALDELPGQVIEACFPGQSAAAIAAALKQPGDALLKQVLARALRTVPALIVRLTATLCEIEEHALLDDPALGLEGLVELLSAWLEVNRMGDFLRAARSLIRQFQAANPPPDRDTGSSGSSPRD